MKLGSKIGGFFGYIGVLISGLFKKLFSLLELFLFIRLTLKLVSANPQSPVVVWIYEWSDKLVSPFDSIFADILLPSGYFLEMATIAAIVGYAILFFIIMKLFRLF